ncbi:MAG: acyltransferase family protein [Clostridia bacterium]|nr:acyltransferase family protein [Clostridia bacterium]
MRNTFKGVFGHVIMGVRLSGVTMPAFFFELEKFIWSFHVPLFLFLSGYIYKITKEWKSKGRRLRFIKHKLINLGIPYVFFPRRLRSDSGRFLVLNF